MINGSYEKFIVTALLSYSKQLHFHEGNMKRKILPSKTD